MRLLFLAHDYPPLTGASSVFIKNIAEGLAARGHQVTIITTWLKGEKVFSGTANLKVVRLKSKRKYIYQSGINELLSWMSSAKKYLRKYLEKEKFDLCVANSTLPAGEVAYSMKLLYKIPYVIKIHPYDIPWSFPGKMKWIHAFAYQWIRKICLQSEINYVHTEEMKANINSFLGKSFSLKNKVIRNGFDNNYPIPDYSERSSDFIIMFPGKLVKEKDPLTFLKAIDKVKNNIPQMKVHIAGDGKMKKTMQKYVSENGLGNVVEFKSWLTPGQLADEYRRNSLAVIPDPYQAGNINLLESVFSGQYVITNKNGSNKDIIKPGINGDFFGISDADDLAGKITDYYNEKFMQNYFPPASEIEKLNVQFDWKVIIDEYEEDFDKITFRNKISGSI